MADILENKAFPSSILDTDLYKLTMQQAVLQHFPNVHAVYHFTNRTRTTSFSRQCVDNFQESVSRFTNLALTESERTWLESTCPYLSKDYLDYLSAFRFNPDQVSITFIPDSENNMSGQIEIEASGPWVETILWEVPLMATLSETYFQTDDTDWNYEGQEELAFDKGKTLFEAGCSVSEFGTRRRRSFQTQDLVVRALIHAAKENTNTGGRLNGTSNVHLARKYGSTPIGTIAHEWFMAIGALKGYENVNELALQCWEEVYAKTPTTLIALTDTFSTEAFFKEFMQDPGRAQKWTGLRQDSGDPLVFAPRVKEAYQALGINYREKLVVYSDALNVNKVLAIQKQCKELGFERVGYGIGTFLTNDFRRLSSGEKSKALNIVIKIQSVDGRPCVKLSDDPTKNTGDKDTIEHIKEVFQL
ncbi:hypothetical protein Agabi119p4_5471 [Agaricus bisporus var. burnettii]|uniref:Nicotinate phosphoribosyltransferase n=1 Tax=Agaricus bisporus var. burnettii TaxID=192524 RepID=A0A8H7F1U1_AGABI|nr:hypothetical protein Agabi119p4_5471 [Agaricus bisporus var. burnettii]